MIDFNLSADERLSLFQSTIRDLENMYANPESRRVSPQLDHQEVLDFVYQHDFARGIDYHVAIRHTLEGLQNHTVHTSHPGYYGLFNPRSNFAGILADLITASVNPQMAAWSHAPFAAEVENRIVKEFGLKFGYPEDRIDGVFGAGGAEANLTAVLCAINHHFEDFAQNGMRGLSQQPLIYCSSEAHHSVARAARVVGLGASAVRSIPADQRLKMNTVKLVDQIEEDLRNGYYPFMVIATAGTTGAGTIDDLEEIGQIAKKYHIWYHVDAAYGGACVLHSEFARLLQGIENSDSITFDLHKWLSVPMAASLLITSQPQVLHKTFGIETEYMPKEAMQMRIVDPYTHSIQWSRRFIGLKIYLSLLFYGFQGYHEIIGNQVDIANQLRYKLKQNDWVILNDTALPVICFSDSTRKDDDFVRRICARILSSGNAWISVYPIHGQQSLRACITNYMTNSNHLDILVDELNQARVNESV